jgi:hypothetical protein
MPLCRTCDLHPAAFRATDTADTGSWPICARCIVTATQKGIALTVEPLVPKKEAI